MRNIGGVSMSRVKLTPVNGQIDTFDLTGADGQPFIANSTPKASGAVLGCTETITLIHHIKDDDTYECHTVNKASWYSKNTITTSGDGAKPVNTYDVRVFGDFIGITPSTGDYVVRGIIENIETPRDLNGVEYFRITSVSDNRRGGLPHWRLSGQ